MFERHGWEAAHWSEMGDPRATDRTIMAWAAENGCIVFTHDLDFGAILAGTQAQRPSVIQVRARDVLPDHLETIVAAAIGQLESFLQTGALVIVAEAIAAGGPLETLESDCRLLTPYAVMLRYPGAADEPSEEDGREAVTAAEHIYQQLREALDKEGMTLNAENRRLMTEH